MMELASSNTDALICDEDVDAWRTDGLRAELLARLDQISASVI
jgi:hypothetical protein